MCWFDSQSKKLIHLKYLILETPYTFFSIFSWYFSFTHTEHVSPVFSVINNNNLSFFCLKDIQKMLQYFCVCFYRFENENVYF